MCWCTRSDVDPVKWVFLFSLRISSVYFERSCHIRGARCMACTVILAQLQLILNSFLPGGVLLRYFLACFGLAFHGH